MSWLQIGSVAAVVCLVLFRVIPWGAIVRRAKKPAATKDPLAVSLATLARYCADSNSDEAWNAWRILVELAEENK